MKFAPHFAFFAFFLIPYSNIQAQLLWQYTSSADGIRRGDYIFGTASGMYVLTDEDGPSSLDAKPHLLYFNKTGALQWKQKIDLGSPEFEQGGFIGEPVLTPSGNLVYSKMKVWDDFSWGWFLERFKPDGSQTEIMTQTLQNQVDVDVQGNIYGLSNISNGYLLKQYNSNLSPTDSWSFPTYSGTIKPLGNNEFYQYGYLYQAPDGKATFGARNLGNDGAPIWEIFYEPTPQLTLLDRGQILASTVDDNGNIYMLLGITYENGQGNYILQKVSNSGILLWQYKTSVSDASVFAPNTLFLEPKILADNNDNCYLIGTVVNFSNGYDGFINKFSPDGNLLWGKRVSYNNLYPTHSLFKDAILDNGHIVVTGWYAWRNNPNIPGTEVTDLLAMKINATTGNLEWKASYFNSPNNTSSNYKALAITGTSDSIFLTGAKTNPTASVSEVLVAGFITPNNFNFNGDMLKWTSFAWTTDTDNPTDNLSENFTVYPNPAVDKISLKTSDLQETGRLTIYNSGGQQVLRMENTGNRDEINIANLPTGFYGLQWQTNRGIWRSKMIKQ